MTINAVAKDGTRRGCYPRSAKHRERIADALRGRSLPAEVREKVAAAARRNARNPEWLRKVSEGTKRNYNHEAQARGTREALARRGKVNFFVGGQGAAPCDYVERYARVLAPAGFVTEFPLQWGGRGQRYRLDFAHVEAKVNIEIDGSSHNRPARRAKDAERDARLCALGWKVIRVREW
jgi:hypothetical protein